MKKIKLSLSIILLFLLTQMALSNGVDYNPNQSAEYVKTLNRNASLETDSAYFNPAGTAIMDSGLYIYLSNQTIYRPVEMKKGSSTKEGEKSAYYFPNIYIVYNRNNTGPGNLAVSLGFLSIGGNDAFEYENGLHYIDDNTTLAGFLTTPISSEFRCIASYYSFQLNFAYSFLNNGLSFSVGYRFIYVMNKYIAQLKDSNTYDEEFVTELTGMSHGLIAGLSSMPIKNLIIGLRYEWHMVMKLKSDVIQNETYIPLLFTFLADDSSLYKIIPMSLSFGISYSIIGIKMEVNVNYFMNKQTRWPKLSNKYDDGFETGFGIDYTLPMVPLNIGLGYLYTSTGGNIKSRNEFHETLDSHAFGFGLSYNIMETLKITLAYSFAYYMPESLATGIRFYKMGHDVGIGLEFKAM